MLKRGKSAEGRWNYASRAQAAAMDVATGCTNSTNALDQLRSGAEKSSMGVQSPRLDLRRFRTTTPRAIARFGDIPEMAIDQFSGIFHVPCEALEAEAGRQVLRPNQRAHALMARKDAIRRLPGRHCYSVVNPHE